MRLMSVTDPTFHPEISSLNVDLSLKRRDMSVTRLVHQEPIGQPQILLKLTHDSDEELREQFELI